MDFGIIGKCVVVLGVLIGFGYVCVEVLIVEGVCVVICSCDVFCVEVVVECFGYDMVVLQVDVGCFEDVVCFIDQVMIVFGSVDILVLNVGGFLFGKLLSIEFDVYCYVFDFNFLVIVVLCNVVVGLMCEQGWGCICVIIFGGV